MLDAEKDGLPEKVKIAQLLNLLGSEELEIFNTFKLKTLEDKIH